MYETEWLVIQNRSPGHCQWAYARSIDLSNVHEARSRNPCNDLAVFLSGGGSQSGVR